MRIAAAQVNPIVGDFDGNARRIIASAQAAAASGARVLVTPELVLVGYPPEDLLFRAAFLEASQRALQQVCAATSGLDLHLLLGHPARRAGALYNAASLVHRGRVLAEYHKHELPNYRVFDDARYFSPGSEPLIFEVDGVRFGVLVCEDYWAAQAPKRAVDAGAQVLLALNASPYELDKQHRRLDVARANVAKLGAPLFAANLVGGQDELVFDGLSFALNADGRLATQAPAFEEALFVADLAPGTAEEPPAFAIGAMPSGQPIEEQLYAALRLGVRDYIDKNGFPGVLIGLSGGVDSALTLAIAVDALGAHRVRAVMMPSPYTADISIADAREMASRLGVRYDEIPIAGCFDAFLAALAPHLAGPPDTTQENLQARIRAVLLMALSNRTGALVLTTGNKSEMAVGYSTLYGDMAGGFAVVKDVSKTMVWRLSNWRNARGEVIPQRIITRAPSAELKPGQLDQDSLPPYDVLDAIVEQYVELDRDVEDIAAGLEHTGAGLGHVAASGGDTSAAGFDEATVRRVAQLIRGAEYKRRQAPLGIRVTHRAFGRDWRHPVTSRFRD
jgi:NAD+ synthase (glutamine-hydrolysing)